jgi:hypothetical protein
MDNAKRGSFVVLLSDKVQESIDYVTGLLKNEKQEKQKKPVNQNSYN